MYCIWSFCHGLDCAFHGFYSLFITRMTSLTHSLPMCMTMLPRMEGLDTLNKSRLILRYVLSFKDLILGEQYSILVMICGADIWRFCEAPRWPWGSWSWPWWTFSRWLLWKRRRVWLFWTG